MAVDQNTRSRNPERIIAFGDDNHREFQALGRMDSGKGDGFVLVFQPGPAPPVQAQFRQLFRRAQEVTAVRPAEGAAGGQKAGQGPGPGLAVRLQGGQGQKAAFFHQALQDLHRLEAPDQGGQFGEKVPDLGQNLPVVRVQVRRPGAGAGKIAAQLDRDRGLVPGPDQAQEGLVGHRPQGGAEGGGQVQLGVQAA